MWDKESPGKPWDSSTKECPHCNGYGNTLDSDEQFCPACRGTGVDHKTMAVPAGPPPQEPQLPEGVYVE